MPFLSGFWIDVTVNPRGEIIRARSDGNAVIVQNVTRGTEWRQLVPTDFLRYLKVAATAYTECAIGVGDGDAAFIVERGAAIFYTKVHGQDAVAIVALPDGTFVPYAVVTGLEWMRGWERKPLPERLRGTSQGFRQVKTDMAVVFGDDAIGVARGGHIIARPIESDHWTVGQRNDDGIGCFEKATRRYFSVPALRGFKVAEGVGFTLTPAGVLVVCAATPQGAFYQEFPPPYPPHEPAAPNPGPPTPDPVPPTPKPPEPVPMNPMTDAIHRIIDRYVAIFPVPRILAPGETHDAFEDRCRQWCRRLAEQIHFDTKDPRWGVKNAGGGRPQSKDAIAYNGDRLLCWDLLLAVGTGTPTRVERPDAIDITGQEFMPVFPANHLGSTPGPTTPTDPPPPTGPVPHWTEQARAEISEIATLRMGLALLTRRLEALEARSGGGTSPTPVSINGLRIALKAHNGQYVVAEGGGGQEVLANRNGAGAWETFTIEVQ